MSKKLAIAMFGQKRLSREGGVEIVVKELCTRMAQNGCDVTCYNRAGHHVSGAEYDDAGKTEYEGIRQKSVPTIERRGLAAVSSSFFAALCSAFGRYDVVHIHAEGPAFFAWLPKMFGKRVVVSTMVISFERKPDYSDIHMSLNKFFLNERLCEIMHQKKEPVLYIPFASNTTASCLRTFILSFFSRRKEGVLFALRYQMNPLAKLFLILSGAKVIALSEACPDGTGSGRLHDEFCPNYE